ncbi:hypothetical protein C7413_115113 [Paraburkholderia silvatlantica]|nr:hypothetical protein C7411_116113 [Paraburkholderia silvatlantica]PXW36367.1 hypothetical protein C7413_115113 [Paraburkholderia silvatlantica]
MVTAAGTLPGRIAQTPNEGHLGALSRALLLSAVLAGINIAGGIFLWKLTGRTLAQIETAITLAAFVTVLTGAPQIAFLCLGWYARYREFENSLKGKALSAYLQRYWSKRLIQALVAERAVPDISDGLFPSDERWREAADQRLELCDRLFARIYHEQYGLPAFVPPFVIMLCVVYAAAALVGCNYDFGQSDIAAERTGVYGITQQVLVASFGGALMFVVSDSVLSIRRRALNVSDVYWYALRVFLATPLAMVMGGTDGAGAALVFALGTFPVEALLKIVRRFGFPQLTPFEKAENPPDKLLSLTGVTIPIVSVFESEGINSVEQVASADPVILSIRTGFPFRFTLRLCSQAIVRRHFGESAASLIPVGLVDVVPIWLLMKAEDGETSANMPKIDDSGSVLEDAANRLLPDDPPQQRMAVVKMKFRQIAAEEFTVMLARITPLDPSL